MDFITDLGKKLTETAKTVTKKSEDIVEITKLNLAVGNEEDKIRRTFSELGSELYKSYLLGNSFGVEFDSKCSEIKEMEESVARNKEKVLALKGSKVCKDCKSIIDKDVNFCPNCGSKAEMPVEIEAPVIEIVDSEE